MYNQHLSIVGALAVGLIYLGCQVASAEPGAKDAHVPEAAPPKATEVTAQSAPRPAQIVPMVGAVKREAPKAPVNKSKTDELKGNGNTKNCRDEKTRHGAQCASSRAAQASAKSDRKSPARAHARNAGATAKNAKKN